MTKKHYIIRSTVFGQTSAAIVKYNKYNNTKHVGMLATLSNYAKLHHIEKMHHILCIMNISI